jgi:hypothetical protein
MIKRTLTGFVALLLCLVFMGTALALEKGNSRKGKYTYRKVYKSCMERGAVESPKPTVNPDVMTRAQWEQVFEKKAFDQFGCEAEWDALSMEELGDIYSYLWEFAADSPTPAKCK